MINRIKELREARDMSLGTLAALVGTTNQQISHLELGKRRLTSDWMVKIAAVLDCHPWELVEATTLIGLNPHERHVLELFQCLPAAEREAFILLASAIVGEKA